MAKGQRQAADKQLGTTNTTAAGYGSNASSLFGPLSSEASTLANSTGYDPATLAAITNAGMGAVNANFASNAGQIGRNAAVTQNPASVNAALDQNAMNKGVAAGQEAGNIQIANAQEKDYQQALGLNLQNSLYGTNVGAQTNLLGQTPGLLNARAAGQSTLQQVGGLIGDLGQAAGGAAGVAKAACWVAAKLYGGWYAPETVLIRKWLYATPRMRPFVRFYERFGQLWAELMDTHLWAYRLAQIVFGQFLMEAQRGVSR